MQHLVVETAKPDHLISNDWVVNGIGKKGKSEPYTEGLIFNTLVVSHDRRVEFKTISPVSGNVAN